jgi:hypothetical protein
MVGSILAVAVVGWVVGWSSAVTLLAFRRHAAKLAARRQVRLAIDGREYTRCRSCHATMPAGGYCPACGYADGAPF